jgi:hypothetical protein
VEGSTAWAGAARRSVLRIAARFLPALTAQKDMAMRLGLVSSVCEALLTFAAANAAGAGGIEHAAAATYLDAVGDAGDAPDIARVTIRPEPGRFVVDVKLAKPTALGRYGWILFGIDTDRNPFTGGGRGDELLVVTNGDATTPERWVDGRFTPSSSTTTWRRRSPARISRSCSGAPT